MKGEKGLLMSSFTTDVVFGGFSPALSLLPHSRSSKGLCTNLSEDAPVLLAAALRSDGSVQNSPLYAEDFQLVYLAFFLCSTV